VLSDIGAPVAGAIAPGAIAAGGLDDGM